MIEREAACSCGQLKVRVDGDPVRVTACHCLACQRRTGSVFGAQARFAHENVRVIGRSRESVRTSDAGDTRTYNFCPECGATVYYVLSSAPDIVVVPVGAFADPSFPPPSFSIWESRKHAWVTLPGDVQHHD